jgi:hypothetical protein
MSEARFTKMCGLEKVDFKLVKKEGSIDVCNIRWQQYMAKF